MRLLILPDPANVFAPSENAILLPLSLPEAPIGILPTTSPPARSTAEVDMSAFDENMDPSSSSLSSSLKRDRDSPAEVKPVGTKVRILPLRMRVFLLFSMGVLEAFFYRGVRKMQISLPFASRSICFFGAWRWGGRRPVFCACTDSLPTEPILKCFSGPFCPRSHRCCASTLPIQNARQPSWAFCCALGGWWLGRCGVAGAPVVHLRGGQEPNVGRGAVYTGIFVGTLATYAPIPAVFFSFSLLLSTSGRALVMLGPGAAHGCPPLSGACHRGAHQQKKTGGDPKSHVGAPGHYCSRGARRGVFFLLLPDAGALMGRRALGVASRGGAHPKWPL